MSGVAVLGLAALPLMVLFVIAMLVIDAIRELWAQEEEADRG